jgi:hypothetical protein
MEGSNLKMVGNFNSMKVLEIFGVDNKKLVELPINELKEAWQKPIRW